MRRWSTVQTQLKVSAILVSGSMQGTVQSDTHLSLPIREPSIAHPSLPGQPVNHRPPLSHGAWDERGGRGGVGEEGEEMWLDGWLKLSEITADPLQQS